MVIIVTINASSSQQNRSYSKSWLKQCSQVRCRQFYSKRILLDVITISGLGFSFFIAHFNLFFLLIFVRCSYIYFGERTQAF